MKFRTKIDWTYGSVSDRQTLFAGNIYDSKDFSANDINEWKGKWWFEIVENIK